MNASSLQGGAFGMRISSINKLADTKASNVSSLTLLHVLAGVTRRQFPHLLKFLHDLKDTGQAARSKLKSSITKNAMTNRCLY